MSIIHAVRVALLSVVVLFSVVILALAAHLTSTTESESIIGYYFPFAALAIGISLITILTVTPTLVFDHKGFFTSKIIVELPVLSVLGILWLTTGADTATLGSFVFGCAFDGPCHEGPTAEAQAIEAFSFLNWLMLMGYCITLIVLSVIAGNRGHTVWKSSVRETNFFAPGPSVAQPEVHKTEYSPYTAPAQGYQGAGNYSPYAAPTQGYRGAGNV